MSYFLPQNGHSGTTTPIPGWHPAGTKTMASQETADFTKRTLMALATALADHKERSQQIEVMVLALAVAAGLPGVLPAPAG